MIKEFIFAPGISVRKFSTIKSPPKPRKTSEKNVANKSKIDIVFGHSHRAQDVRIPKISNIKNDFTRILNLGCALPHNHIEKYARHSLTGWTYQVCEIDIWDNHIQEVKNISMESLENEFAKNKKKKKIVLKQEKH